MKFKKRSPKSNKPINEISQLMAFGEYSKAKWAYYYAYPEYFPAYKMPSLPSEHTQMIRHTKTISARADNNGTLVIMYTCALASLSNYDGRTSSLITYVDCDPTIEIPFENDYRCNKYVTLPIEPRTRICGGYLKVTPLSPTGIIMHGEFMRRPSFFVGSTYALNVFTSINTKSDALVLRYRNSSHNPQFNDAASSTVYHVIYASQLIPNSVIEIEYEETYESLCDNPSRITGNEFELVTQSDYDEVILKAKSLAQNMPMALQKYPLENPMLYPILFTGGYENETYFNIRKKTIYRDVINQNTFIFRNNANDFARMTTPGMTPQHQGYYFAQQNMFDPNQNFMQYPANFTPIQPRYNYADQPFNYHNLIPQQNIPYNMQQNQYQAPPNQPNQAHQQNPNVQNYQRNRPRQNYHNQNVRNPNLDVNDVFRPYNFVRAFNNTQDAVINPNQNLNINDNQYPVLNNNQDNINNQPPIVNNQQPVNQPNLNINQMHEGNQVREDNNQNEEEAYVNLIE